MNSELLFAKMCDFCYRPAERTLSHHSLARRMAGRPPKRVKYCANHPTEAINYLRGTEQP